VLNLTKVFAEEGSVPFQFPLDLSEIDFYGTHPFSSPVQVSGVVENFAGIVLLKAKVQFVFSAPCDRCAAPVEKNVEFTVEHVIVAQVEDDENDEFVVAENMQLDVEELLRDDLILWVPAKNLCKEDCKGLCDKCGKNLNEGECDCNKQSVDPRLEILNRLLQND
jgi:uncharacterized protein